MAATGEVAAQSAKEVKVGLIVPYTGVYALLGKEIDEGFMLALEEEGMTGSLAIMREDTEANPAVGLGKAHKLVLEDRATACGHCLLGRRG